MVLSDTWTHHMIWYSHCNVDDSLKSFGTWCHVNGKVKLSLCMPWRHMGTGDIDPLILNRSTRWGWVVSFIIWSLYPLMHWRVDEPLSQAGYFGEEIGILALVEIKPHIPHGLAWNWTVASMAGVPQPTAWAITQPLVKVAKMFLKDKGTANESWGVQ